MKVPYQKHSITSQEAANNNCSAKKQKNTIYALIASSGEDGMTNHEIKNRTLINPGTISARLRDLELAGTIVKTNLTRTNPESGCSQSVYVTKRFCDRHEVVPAKQKIDYDKAMECLNHIVMYIEMNDEYTLTTKSPIYKKILEVLS